MAETYCQAYSTVASILDTILSNWKQAMTVDCQAKDFKI